MATKKKPAVEPAVDLSAELAALDNTRTDPVGKATHAARQQLRCLVCGNVTAEEVCPVDGNRIA